MLRSGLASVVLRVVLSGLDFAGHGSNVDDGATPTFGLLGGPLKQRQESGSHEVDLADVGAVDALPVFEVGVLVVKESLFQILCTSSLGVEGSSRYASVVDEDVKVVFLFGEVVVELGDVLLGRDVGSEGDDLALDSLVVSLSHAIHFVFSAANDVDLCTIDSEGLSGHKANATTAASNEGYLVFDIEDIGQLEAVVVVLVRVVGLLGDISCVVVLLGWVGAYHGELGCGRCGKVSGDVGQSR